MATLIEQVQSLNQHYLDNKEEIQTQRQKDLEQKRQDARTAALSAITDGCVETMKAAATSPGRTESSARKEAKLYEWKFSEDTQFNGCYLRDLLNKGNLLEELQLWFDKTHPGQDGSRVFKVYYTMLGNGARFDSDRRYAIFVSWDQEDWERIDDLIQRTKARFDPSQQQEQEHQHQQPRQNVPRGGPRQFTGRGGRVGGRAGGRGNGGRQPRGRVAPRMATGGDGAAPQGYQAAPSSEPVGAQ